MHKPLKAAAGGCGNSCGLVSVKMKRGRPSTVGHRDGNEPWRTALTLLLPEHYQLYPRVRNQINEFTFSLPSLNRWNGFVILVRAKLTVQRLTCRLATRGLAVIGPLAVFFLLTSCQFDSCSTGCFANFYASTNSRVRGSLVGPICRYFSSTLEFFERYRSGSCKVCFPIGWFVRKFNAVAR